MQIFSSSIKHYTDQIRSNLLASAKRPLARNQGAQRRRAEPDRPMGGLFFEI